MPTIFPGPLQAAPHGAAFFISGISMLKSKHAEIVNAYARLVKAVSKLVWPLYLAGLLDPEASLHFSTL
jgi:hypothetical protein